MRFGATQNRPQWLQVWLGLAVVAATYLYLILTRPAGLDQPSNSNSALIAYVGYLAGAVLILWGVARQFTTATYALLPIAIAINIAIGQIVPMLKLPLYLDSIGTVLVGVLVGPWAGAATGALANVIWGLTLSPIAMPFAVVAIVIGLLAGWFARIGWFKRFPFVLLAGLITAIVAALLSAPISAFLFGGVTGGGGDILVAAFRSFGQTLLAATTLQGLVQEWLDKPITFALVYLIVTALPARMRTRFSQSPPTTSSLPS